MRPSVAWTGLLCWMVVPVETPGAHGVLDRMVQHHIMVTVGESYLDVTVELTFHSVFAQRERERLDANGDGLIEAEEGERYLRGTLSRLEAGLRMTAGKREIALTRLHHPELDLLGSVGTGAHPLRTRVFYVARLDPGLRQARVVDLENRLWREAPALCFLELRTRSGPGRVGRRLTSLFGPGSPRRLSFELRPVSAPVER